MLRSRQKVPFLIWTLPFAAGTRIHFSSDGGSSGLGPYWHLENSKPASRQMLPPLLGCMIRYLLTLAAGVADALAGREKLTATPAAAMTVVTAFSSPRLNMATSLAGGRRQNSVKGQLLPL